MPVRADDTIVACATAPGRGAIAIVRLSGGNAMAIARRVATGIPAIARLAGLTALHSPDQPDQPIDHGLVTWFEGPHSYTGEDVVEFAVHGGALVSTLVVEACVTAGARPALAGEFTERAVLNGKLDLVQAEAVADLIDARSRAAHRAAVRQLDGALSKRLTAMREALLQVDALLAYDIDFPEEDEAAPSRARVLAACDEAIGQVDQLLATLPAATLGREGALVVLAGPPNAGKSALLNALVGEARVIVSEIPGTTRDAVEVLVDDTPYPLRLVDTAGLRASGDRLERLGIEVSERYVAQAHVVLVCAETPASLERTVEAVAGITAGVVVAVLTKADLLTPSSPRSSRRTAGGPRSSATATSWGNGNDNAGFVRVSAFTGEGLDLLREEIRRAVTSRVAAPGDDTPIVTRARHEAALRRAGEELRDFRAAWAVGALPAPVAATHLRAAVTALEELIGAVDVEDVLERVFRTFCVGK
ncbi:MAG: tRNA uridine-5-carboxymethylaminomethyl(34) synthesis GTPase MnmE [Gemmatimonas sp.]|nr:tRNA uridine-5-carboxymethylaminomethyl(34) synthesis GTPase MnmE [Gemmatimonas sp.]